MKILIAEDDRLTREGLVEVLSDEGYDVVSAPDGGAAVREFRSARPDFVCLDIMMPDQSGYEACRQIRAEAPDIPIIFISAKSEEIDLVGFELGADDFIAKPFGVRGRCPSERSPAAVTPESRKLASFRWTSADHPR